MKTDEFYVVYNPTKNSERADIFSGEPTSLQNLYNQFHGGLKPDMIHGIYTRKSEAMKDAYVLYEKLLSTRNEDDPFSFPIKERFGKFVTALEELSARFGVAIQSTGGVIILNEKKKIFYSRDHTSGDLEVNY